MSKLLGVQSDLQQVVQSHINHGCTVIGVCDEVEVYYLDDAFWLKRVHLRRTDGSHFDIYESEGGTNQWPQGFYVLTNLHLVDVD